MTCCHELTESLNQILSVKNCFQACQLQSTNPYNFFSSFLPHHFSWKDETSDFSLYLSFFEKKTEVGISERKVEGRTKRGNVDRQYGNGTFLCVNIKAKKQNLMSYCSLLFYLL